MKHDHCLICSKAGSLQMIKAEDRSPSIHTNGEVNIIRSFIISSKANQANWKTSIECTRQLARDAKTHDFMISPELINAPLNEGGGGHYFGTDTYEDLIQGYANHSHGKIVDISPEYKYNDGTGDIYFMGNIKLRDSKAAAVLMEHGPKLWTPFAVSPHIYPVKYNNNGEVAQAKFVGVALVIKGAYGDDAVITKHCTGNEAKCMQSLSASVCCDKEDSLAATLINGIVRNDGGQIDSSLLLKNPDKGIMSEQVQVNKPKETPVEEEKPAKNTVNIAIKELEELKKLADEAKVKDEELTKLVTKDKTNTINSIFKVVADQDTKTALLEKYLKQDTDSLHSFVQDYEKHVLPIKIKEALESANKETPKEEKSKGASLRPEPKEDKDKKESEAASIVPKNVNAVIDFDSLMRGETY